METVDEEFLAAAKDFIDRQHRAEKPFFVWFNATRMHVFTHLKPESVGKTGKGLHADGMSEHDGHVGQLLKQLDDLGIADDTIVLYTTDNGAELALWPDGAMTPFHGEKGTTWEGGLRIPMMVRWPGVVKPGTQINEIVTLMDWMPTFAAAAGIPNLKESMRSGFAAGTKTFKVHLDGYDLTALLKGEARNPPREAMYYFDQGGNLNAIRWNDWKLSFAVASEGNIATATREIPSWALITNLRMDPYERGMKEGGGALEFLAQNMWLLVPIQGKIKEFFSRFRPVPLSGGQLAECERHQLRIVAPAGGPETPQRDRTADSLAIGNLRPIHRERRIDRAGCPARPAPRQDDSHALWKRAQSRNGGRLEPAPQGDVRPAFLW